jgi:hypothetical protein
MAFSIIKPMPLAKVGSIKLRSQKTGAGWRLVLSLPTTTMVKAKWFDIPASLVVMIGDGSDEGKLRITGEREATVGQGIKPTVLKHTVMLRLPPADWMPQFEENASDLRAAFGEGSIDLELPEWAWNKDRQKAIETVRRQNAAGAVTKRPTAPAR